MVILFNLLITKQYGIPIKVSHVVNCSTVRIVGFLFAFASAIFSKQLVERKVQSMKIWSLHACVVLAKFAIKSRSGVVKTL